MGTFFTLLIVAAIVYYSFVQIKKSVRATKQGSCIGCDCSKNKCSKK